MQKGFVPILILVGVLIVAGLVGGVFYLGRQTAPKALPNPVVTSNIPAAPPAPDETANWKTYTNQNPFFSIKYPTSWQVVEKKYWENYPEIVFSGLEGQVAFKIGTGFGGGCPVSVTVKIFDQELPACQTKDGERVVFEQTTNIPIDLGNGVMDKLSIQVESDINPPIQKNKETILKTLATIKFTK